MAMYKGKLVTCSLTKSAQKTESKEGEGLPGWMQATGQAMEHRGRDEPGKIRFDS
jgi:hypothetical protein